MSKMRRKNGVKFLRILDIFTESFLTIFVKNTGHRVTKIYPVVRNDVTYKFYFMSFFLARKKIISCFIYAILTKVCKEGKVE